jgi:hypothetical protein
MSWQYNMRHSWLKCKANHKLIKLIASLTPRLDYKILEISFHVATNICANPPSNGHKSFGFTTAQLS